MVSFSIIVPIYNVENYIEECIESIVDQLEITDELILVNDGSSDASILKIEKYITDNVIFIEQDNAGLSVARNAGLRVACKDYIIFVDSDDYIQHGSLSTLRRHAARTNPDMIITNTRKFGSGKSHVIKPDVNRRPNSLAYLPPAAWDKIYCRKKIQEIGIEFIDGTSFEDMPFTYECLIKFARVEKSDCVLINWRQREESLSRTREFKYYNVDVIKNFENLAYRNQLFFKNAPGVFNQILLKKVLLDSLIRWNKSLDKPKMPMGEIINFSFSNLNYKSLLRSKLSFYHVLGLQYLLLKYYVKAR